MMQQPTTKANKNASLRTVRKSKPDARGSGTTKKARLIQMLSRKAGADIVTISEKFGWLPHTTRAALSGLRKAGFELTSVKAENGKPSQYRITAAPSADAA